MIFRFSLYGFLKNQQYYEPFLVLAFLEKGLSFFQIGILIGFREVCINVFEIPSGALADVWGRRRAMVLSFSSYIVSFVLFWLVESYAALFAAMFFYGLGDAFRTGTHKAMILDWLAEQGRLKEKTRVYGITRSWSQVGSAVSVLIASALVFRTGRYSDVFIYCVIPYVVGLVNVSLYPKELEGKGEGRFSVGGIYRMTLAAFGRTLRRGRLRRLLLESLGFQGLYKATKDYLQPVLKALALGLPVLLALEDAQRAAVVVGAAYFLLYVFNGLASWQSARVAHMLGKEDEDRAARALWGAAAAGFAVLAVALWADRALAAVCLFLAVGAIENLWRPLQLGRIASSAEADKTATILSVESQAVSAFAAVAAPLLGLGVDLLKRGLPVDAPPSVMPFLPVALAGLAVSAAALLLPAPEPEGKAVATGGEGGE